MTYGGCELRLGDVVLWKEPIRDGELMSDDFPAIVYSMSKDTIGITVFRRGIPQRYQAVYYSAEPKEETWRFRPTDC